MPNVSFIKTSINQKKLDKYVLRALELTDWQHFVRGPKIVLKINGVSAFMIPGANTSPIVVDAVCSIIKRFYPDSQLKIVDTDSAARNQFNRTAELWGYTKIAKKYSLEIVNLLEHDWSVSTLSSVNRSCFKLLDIYTASIRRV